MNSAHFCTYYVRDNALCSFIKLIKVRKSFTAQKAMLNILTDNCLRMLFFDTFGNCHPQLCWLTNNFGGCQFLPITHTELILKVVILRI